MSPERDWARDARQLLLEVVGSFETLEVVCALHAASAPQPVAALAKQLGLDRDAVTEAASALGKAHCASEHEGAWRLETAGPWTDAIDALAYGYQHDKIAVLNLMSEAALERIRSSAVKTFADAFRLKKPGEK